jgi:hypothetical protein
MSNDLRAARSRDTQDVIYVEPQRLHDSGFLEELRANTTGYERQLRRLREAPDVQRPIDVLREVVADFEGESLETLTPVIEELRRRNGRFQQRRLVETRKEATSQFLDQLREAFAEVAAEVDMDVAEFEQRCVDPVAVVIELPEETRDALRSELVRFYAARTETGTNDVPTNPSLQTLVTHCIRAARQSPVG